MTRRMLHHQEGDTTWITRLIPRYGECDPTRYVIMIRSPDDPELVKDASRSATWWRDWKKNADHEDLRSRLLEELKDGTMTFNALSVRIANTTADVLAGGPLEEAIWSIVLEGKVQWCPVAPVLFRLSSWH